MNQVIAYKVDSLTNLKPNSIVALKVAGVSKFELFITDLQGAPYSLNIPNAVGGVQQVNNTDGNLDITGATNVVVNLNTTLATLINSALQGGDNISELLNDAGYITSLDLPTKTSDLINDGEDGTSFYIEDDDARLSDARTPLAHTHPISEVSGLQGVLDNKQNTLTDVDFGAFSESLTEKTIIVDADSFNIADSADSNKQKKFSFANLKVSLTSFFNGLFAKVNLDSTTIISGTGVSINADPTKFDINVTGKIVDPITFISTPIVVNLTAQTTTYLATQTESYIWINSSGVVIQSLTAPTSDILDNILGHWVLIHSNLTSINVVNDFANFTDGVGVQLLQSLTFDGFRKKVNSNIVSAGTTGTRLSHSGGLVIKAGGGGFLTKRPVFSLISGVDSTFRMRNRNDSEGADTQLMGVTSYDLAGVTTTLANNKFSAHKVWKFSSSILRVQRGQKEYANIESALIGIDVDTYVDSPNGSRNGIHIGWVIFKKGTSWGSGGAGVAGIDYKFVDVQGGKSTGGGFLANLQSSYNVSDIPQILINAIKGAFTLQSATGVDSDNIFQGRNNAGTLTSWIKGDGTSSFISKNISTLTAVTLPLVDTDKLIVNRGGVDYSVDKSEFFKQQYVDISTSTYAITSADHNKIFRIHTTCTITIQSGLRVDFTCTGLNDNGVVTNFALGAGVTSSTNSDGTTLASKKMFALIMTNVVNTISIKGELT